MTTNFQQQSLSTEVINITGGVSSSPEPVWSYAPDFLDLQYWRTIACKKTQYDLEVVAELLTLPVCPDCDQVPAELKPTGTLVQSVKDEPKEGLRVEIYFIRQRFECLTCGRHLSQPLPGIVKGHAITHRGARFVAYEALNGSFEAAENKSGVSSKTVKELFADLICGLEASRKIEAPEMIGIDGVCVGRRRFKRSYCLVTNLSDSKVLELLDKSTQLPLARFLVQLPKKENIKFVAIDMSMGFQNVIKKVLPQAIVIIDPFHVLRKLNDAVTKVVKTKQSGLTMAERKKLMKGGNRFLLLKRRFKLTEGEREQLEKWFVEVPEFRQAYDIKEAGFDIWLHSKSSEDAEIRFAKWEESIPDNLEPAFRAFRKMIRRWKKPIFNFFDCRVSNAFTESKNRDIKSLQRHGRRTSFPVLRARLLYANFARKPPRPKSNVKAGQIRKAMKEAKKMRSPAETWDPNSYVARINQARKDTNEFSRLMRPGRGWIERFGHYSYYSKEKSPFKWDFIW